MAISGFLTSTKRGKLNNSDSAFTLIEIVIVMSIIIVLSTILVGYTRESGKRLMLTTTEAKMLSLISRAKFLSVETFFKEEETASGEKICGYGVRVEGNELFIFQDKVGSSDPCSLSDHEYNVDNTLDFKMTGELDKMTIDTQVFEMTPTLQNIVFIPPDPDVIINGNEDEENAKITVDLIGVTNGTEGFTITVNNAGQVKTD
jgi:competence protein ComGC